jgi:hypothetical protein
MPGMQRDPRDSATYPVVVPIDTNRGPGETRRIGSRSITFAIATPFEVGDPLRFRLSLAGDGTAGLDVAGWGSVAAVTVDGDRFVVEASIEPTAIRIGPQAGR